MVWRSSLFGPVSPSATTAGPERTRPVARIFQDAVLVVSDVRLTIWNEDTPDSAGVKMVCTVYCAPATSQTNGSRMATGPKTCGEGKKGGEAAAIVPPWA